MPELEELIRPAKFSPTERTLDILLTEHREAQETLHRGAMLGVKSGTRAWGLDMPATWTKDHAHLAILLGEYQDYCKLVSVVLAKQRARELNERWATVNYKRDSDYTHLAQWYFLCRITSVPVWLLDKKGKPRLNSQGEKIQRVQSGEPQWERIIHRGTQEYARVHSGLKWIGQAWRLGRPPQCISWEKLLEPKTAA